MHSVHIAYGFHVNCYHSYRGDSNDELGFGGDIRIIRRIIQILDDCNARGIPVRGTWDFENAYSLEDILPKYAPDIIAGVQKRVRENGDENILMGYNNGALAAMTPTEFDASIQLALTNDKGSGLLDVFGECARIVRPQEVMFTPSQVRDYKRNGMEAVCLYYSCVPFDAFRTITPQLTGGKEFNPVTFSYKGESLTILPTYSNADVMDAGCLRAWAKDLHAKQQRGEINSDVLLFINMDADAILWEPLKLPAPLNKLANTQGILGLVEEVADLPYVVFDTPGGYLKNHKPLSEISFGHDTADGSFTGYSSWAEKPFNRQIWTRMERARALAQCAAQGDAGFNERVLLLSTTHFGLASPVLNIDRERRALALSAQMLQKSLDARAASKTLTAVRNSPADLFTLQVAFAVGFLPQIGCLQVESEKIAHWGALPTALHPDGSVATAFLLLKLTAPTDRVPLQISTRERDVTQNDATPTLLQSEGWQVQFCAHGEILGLKYRGRTVGGKGFLRSALTYNGQHIPFTNKHLVPLQAAGALTGLRVAGDVTLPDALRPGAFAYDFYTLPEVDAVFALTNVQYPYTAETNAIATHSSALGRKSDNRWQEVMPFELRPLPAADLRVYKRNFAGDVSHFPLASFRESVPENENLDSFNHQLTAGFVGVGRKEGGFLLANARQMLGSMAHCPMRLRRNSAQNLDALRLNPFGTYHGKQRVHPSLSGGAVREAFVLVTPQARSLAPAYNGASETAALAFFGYAGDAPDEGTLSAATAFADGAVLLSTPQSPVHAPGVEDENVRFPAVVVDNTSAKELKPVLVSGVMPSPLQTAKIAARAFGNILWRQISARK